MGAPRSPCVRCRASVQLAAGMCHVLLGLGQTVIFFCTGGSVHIHWRLQMSSDDRACSYGCMPLKQSSCLHRDTTKQGTALDARLVNLGVWCAAAVMGYQGKLQPPDLLHDVLL